MLTALESLKEHLETSLAEAREDLANANDELRIRHVLYYEAVHEQERSEKICNALQQIIQCFEEEGPMDNPTA